MPGYVKIYESITRSTIWAADIETRMLWLTMLIVSDKHGNVEGSIPGMANIAGIQLEDCERALGHLMSPDKYSRTEDNEGRRLEKTDGGWRILNFSKYRGQLREDKIAEQNRERQRRYREKQQGNAKSVNRVTITQVTGNHAQAEAEAEAITNSDSINRVTSKCLDQTDISVKPDKPARQARLEYDEDFLRFWEHFPRKENKRGAQRAFRAAKKRKLPHIEELITIVSRQVHFKNWKEQPQYCPHASSWLNGDRWGDEIGALVDAAIKKAPNLESAIEAAQRRSREVLGDE